MERETKKLLEQIKDENLKNYPICNALLVDETDYIKNNYFRHLAMVFAQGEMSRNQRFLFSRMLVGAKAENSIEEYTQQALDMEIGQYVEFMEWMKEKELRYRFLLDAVILVGCDGYDEERQELLASFMESLKITMDEAKFLCEIGKGILAQDEGVHWGNIFERNLGKSFAKFGQRNQTDIGEIDIDFGNFSLDFPLDFASEYAEDFAGKHLGYRTDEAVVLFFPIKEEISDTLLDSLGLKNGVINATELVVIYNAVIYVSETDLLIRGCKNVQFIDCDFIGGDFRIRLDNDNQVQFMNCDFRNFRNRTMIVSCDPDAAVAFMNCHFENCYLCEDRRNDDWKIRGGVIWSELDCTFVFWGTTFTKCGVLNKENYYSSALILNQPAGVESCIFRECWGYHNVVSFSSTAERSINPENERRTLFVEGSVDNGNQIIDSAAFA